MVKIVPLNTYDDTLDWDSAVEMPLDEFEKMYGVKVKETNGMFQLGDKIVFISR